MDIFDKARQLRQELENAGLDSAALEVFMALYYNVLDVQPKRPGWPGRDRLFLNDETLRAAFLAVLADRGYFPAAESESGAPEALPGAEGLCATAAAAAVEEALRAKEDGDGHLVYAVLSDEDCRRGAVWESAERASSLGLSRLRFMLCRRKGGTENICARFSAFGFATCSASGGDIEAVTTALEAFCNSSRPVFICCDI